MSRRPPWPRETIRSRRPAAVRLALALLLGLGVMLGAAPASAKPMAITVTADTPEHTVLDYQLGTYQLPTVTIGGKPYRQIVLEGEARLLEAGAPSLPAVSRSVLIGSHAAVAVNVLGMSYHDIADVDVEPSKGNLYRNVLPGSVPYSFGPEYATDAFYPQAVATLGTPYLLRGYRGVVVTLHPLQYNPVARVLRVIDQVTLEVARVGTSTVNVPGAGPPRPSRAFARLAQRHFLNHGIVAAYAPIDEEGELLVIAHDEWLPNVQPLVLHKKSIGIKTTAVGVASIGNDAGSIKGYIQNAYDSGNLAFVLLVGDVAQVAIPSASGGTSDPSYAKLAGADSYPDILVGRFSAETAAQVDTQVARTIAYELGQATQQPWFKKATGIGSTEGPGDDGEIDYQHIDNIGADLKAHGYTQVDAFYGDGAGAAALVAALNEGRGIVNYCGHGSMNAFSTTGFSTGHVSQLTNTDKLPFVLAVACNVGELGSGTCLAESLLRGTSGGAPTGAIGMYGSSVMQSWDPPMAAQDESVDLLVAEQYVTLGALCFAGSARMMDEYGDAGVEMFDTWHLFGDPSLRVVGTVPPPVSMLVSPEEGLVAQGPAGGPFDVTEKAYTLSNTRAFPIDFAVEHAAPWLTASPAEGTIPAGGSAVVTVALAEAAGALVEAYWQDTVQIANLTDHEGDTTRPVSLTVGTPEPQLDWPLDDDPGWTTEGGWAFGTPAGLGGSELGAPDPTSGHTGTSVYGYALQGDYENALGETSLTSTAIDCSHMSKVSLRFWRWLNVQDGQHDHASVRVSNDGASWTTVWENTDAVADSAWQSVEIDIAAIADGQPTVYLRWTMGATDGTVSASGWNIDDVALWGLGRSCNDHDGDGALPLDCGGDDCDDLDPTAHVGALETCDDGRDNDCDGAVDGADSDCLGGPSSSGGPGSLLGDRGLHGMVCGCRVPGDPAPGRGAIGLLALLGAALGLRRRRRGARASSSSRWHR